MSKFMDSMSVEDNSRIITERVVNVTEDDRSLEDLSVNELRDIMIDVHKHYSPSSNSYEDTWNDEKESLLKKWAEEAFGYAWMHHACISHYKRKDKMWWIPAVILGGIFTGGGLATIGFSFPPIISFITYLGTASGTVLSGIHAQMQYSGRSENHKLIESLYQDFIKQIQEELAKNKDERRDGQMFVNWARKFLKKLRDPDQSPHIPERIINKYKKFIKDKNVNITMPGIAGGINIFFDIES